MIPSPTEKGVLMIGGSFKRSSDKSNLEYSSNLLELTGDSIETLEWKILEQKLQHARGEHFSVTYTYLYLPYLNFSIK